MSGFATVPDALNAAGKAASDAVTALRGADCGGPVAGLGAALPGSTSAGAGGAYADSWQATFPAWCDQAAQHAGNLGQAATNYARTEAGNAATLDPEGGRLRGPR